MEQHTEKDDEGAVLPAAGADDLRRRIEDGDEVGVVDRLSLLGSASSRREDSLGEAGTRRKGSSRCLCNGVYHTASPQAAQQAVCGVHVGMDSVEESIELKMAGSLGAG